MLIDRRDDVIDLCEMKCTDKEFEVTEEYRENLINKATAFAEEVKTDKAIHIILITSNGYKRNEYSDVIQNAVDPDSLFA